MRPAAVLIRRPSLAPLVALAALLVAPTARAEVETYRIDPEHTSVGFKIRHLFSRVPGHFNEFSGTIKVDQENLANSSVSVTIEAASIDTGVEARDDHLRSDAFFDVENHPQITFESTRVRPQEGQSLLVDGKLTIRGVTREVTLDAEILGFGELYSVKRAGFEATTTINRMDYNVSWNDVVEGGGLVLGKEVEIILNVEAKKVTD